MWFGPDYVQWYGKLDASSQTLRSIISVVPSPSLPISLDTFMARIVGGWSKFFALPRGPITQEMRMRTDRGTLSAPDSIRPDEVNAGVTFLEDDNGSWALVFRFKIGGSEPRCYWFHQFESGSRWETSEDEYDKVTADDRTLWFPYCRPLFHYTNSQQHDLRQLANNKTYIWLQNLVQYGSAATLVGGKLVQVVLCPRSQCSEEAQLL